MDTKEEIKKTVVTEPLKEGIKWFLASGCTLLVLYIPAVYHWLASRLSFWLLLVTISFEFLAISVLLSYVFYLRKKLIELTPVLFHKFGIQWDKFHNSYCPKCSNRLGPYTKFYMDGWGFQCFHCNKVYYLFADDGTGGDISFQDAIKAVQNQNAA